MSSTVAPDQSTEPRSDANEGLRRQPLRAPPHLSVNFFPELDFSIFGSLLQFAAVIRRDFEEQAPSETDIVARLEGGRYPRRGERLRDHVLHLFWINRDAMGTYDKRPTRWRDVPVTLTACSCRSSRRGTAPGW